MAASLGAAGNYPCMHHVCLCSIPISCARPLIHSLEERSLPSCLIMRLSLGIAPGRRPRETAIPSMTTSCSGIMGEYGTQHTRVCYSKKSFLMGLHQLTPTKSSNLFAEYVHIASNTAARGSRTRLWVTTGRTTTITDSSDGLATEPDRHLV